MKKLISLVAFCLATLVMNAQLPTALGDFILGSSTSSVEETLNAKGLNKVEIGLFRESTYAYGDTDVPEEGAKIKISFPLSNPYIYAGEKWQYVNIYFYQGKVFKIEFRTGSWYEGGGSASMIKDCQNTYKTLEKKMNSQYAKYRKKGINERTESGEGRIVLNYSDGKNTIAVEHTYYEYEEVSVSLSLFDTALDKKACPWIYE